MKYIRHCIVSASVEEILTLVLVDATHASISPRIDFPKVELEGQLVNICSLRLLTFALKGTTCASCGLKAKYFALEKDANSAPHLPFHLNLWGVRDGEEVLFTHDHILARSLGGVDGISNTQTMCTECNNLKSHGETQLLKQRKEKKKQ